MACRRFSLASEGLCWIYAVKDMRVFVADVPRLKRLFADGRPFQWPPTSRASEVELHLVLDDRYI